MPRKLTRRAARAMQAKRKRFGAGTGRPRKPAPCPKCGKQCGSTRAALGHCA